MNNKTFNETVQELKELKTMKAELEKEIEATEKIVKAEMEKQSKEEIFCGSVIIRYKTIESERLDTIAIKKELPEVVKKYTKKQKIKRFTLI